MSACRPGKAHSAGAEQGNVLEEFVILEEGGQGTIIAAEMGMVWYGWDEDISWWPGFNSEWWPYVVAYPNRFKR